MHCGLSTRFDPADRGLSPRSDPAVCGLSPHLSPRRCLLRIAVTLCVTAFLWQWVQASRWFSVDTSPVCRSPHSIGGGGSGLVVLVAMLLVPLWRLLLGVHL
ncbi:hypothetical protein VPH35_001138 [Triticum aestivum]